MNAITGKRPYTLRSATAADQADIKALIRQNQLNPLGLHWSRFLLAVDNQNAIIGCGQIKPHSDGSHELASIAVVPSWRKQGVAAAMIQQLHSHHNGTLWLTCTSPLIPFYTRYGYREITQLAAMPPYFRRVRRLFNIFTRFSSGSTYLAVMATAVP